MYRLYPVLLEPKIEGIQIAQSKGIKHTIHGRLEDLHIRKNTIPNIGMFDVLEHIEDDNKYIKLCHSLLMNKGKIILTVPAYESLWSNFDTGAGHKRRYSLELLKSKLLGAGFEIVYASYLFYPLPLFIYFKRVLLKSDYLNTSVGKRSKDHIFGRLAYRTFMMILSFELLIFRLGLSMPFGSSCVVVAEKLE